MAVDLDQSVTSTQCPSCGAQGPTESPCGWCGQAVAAPLRARMIEARVDRWTAAQALRARLRLPALRPRALSEAIHPRSLRPVLVPAWSVDVDVDTSWASGERRAGTRRLQCRDLVVPAVDEPLAGVVRAAFRDAAGQPTRLEAARLAEWSPLPVTRTLPQAWAAACDHLAAAAAEEASLGLSLDEAEHLRVETRFENALITPLLVPAWRLAGDGFCVHVEACTGRVVGTLPWNGRRLAGLAAVAGAVLGAAWALLA